MQDAPPAGDATAPADAPKDAAPAEKKKGGKTPMIFYAWGAMSTWLLVDGYLTYNSYTTLASTLVTNKTSNNTAWTTSIVQGNAPISYWLYSSYLAMGLESISVLGWLMGAMGNKEKFFNVTKMAMFFPILEAAAWSFTYFSYSDCASVSDTQFDGSTTTVTQLSSCSGASATTALTGKFGTSGSTAPYVSTDNYTTWFATNVGSDVGMVALNMMLKKTFTKMMAAKKKQAAEKKDADKAATDAAAADPSAAPADPSKPAS